jgi:transcriptional regulator with XRE-family HTH domain
MSRTPRRLMPPTAGRTQIEDHITQQFARRLMAKINDRGWSQSDLAREAFGAYMNKKTRRVEANGRDRISAYLSGKTFPEQRTLKKLADALDTTTEELAPEVTASAIDRENPSYSVTQVPGHEDRVHLVVNQIVPEMIAMEIGMILAKNRQKKVEPAE